MELEYGRTWGCGMTATAKRIDRNCHARTSPHPGTISLYIRVLGPLLAYITARGHDSSAFLREQGVDPMLLRDPEARLPQAVATRLWQAAGQLTNDLNLGIHVAEGIRPESFGALGYALRSSETMGMALQRL